MTFPDFRKLLPASPPVRDFAIANLVNTLGVGLFVTGGTLYFTRVIGLTLAEVGTGLSLTIGLALLVMVPLGRLADRVGARQIYVSMLALQATVMGAYLFVPNFAWFLVAASFGAVADRGINATVGALIHDLAKGNDRVRTRAYLRSTTNVGFAAGSLLAGLALQQDSAWAYRSIIAGNAVMFGLAALLVLRVPRRKSHPEPVSSAEFGTDGTVVAPRSALRDKNYLMVSVANAALTLHFELLSYALPLWIVLRTSAPPWAISVVFSINTAMVVLFQVRVSARIGGVLDAAKLVRRAGGILLGSCLLMAVSARSQGTLTIVVLLVWAITYTFAELLHSSAEFSFSFDLARDDAQGEYQSVFAMARGLAHAIAPVLLTVTVLHPSGFGWIGAGPFLLLTALLTSRLATTAHNARVNLALEKVAV